MKIVDMIVKAPHFYTMEGIGVGYKVGVAMVVDSGKIVAIDEVDKIMKEYNGEVNLDLSHHAIFPGFIDAHMHTGLAIMRGLAQDTNNWMMYGLQPFDNVITNKERLAGSRMAIIEAIKAGTTTIGDYEAYMEPVCEFIHKVGVRGNITSTIREARRRVYKPGELYEYDEEMGLKSFEENIRLFEKWHNKGNGLIKILFGPQGPDFLSKDLLLKIQRVAKEKDTKIHMHTQQGDRETYQVVKRYGKRPIEWLKEIGYLDETLIAVHLTDANDGEAREVAKSGASMIVCPGSIGIIDGLVCPSITFQEAGGNVALGSDQAPGNNSHNIINEMKLITLFNKIKYQNPEVMPAWRALRMATIEGAKAVGLGELIGSLEVGKRADFIAIDLNKPSMLPVFTKPMRNIVPNLVYSARGEEVVLSVVDGKIIYKDGKVLDIDEDEYFNAVAEYTNGIGERASEEFFEINGTNSRFMEENKL
ncbi:amidohydrolase family protein [Tissierella carlieri]|jgi:5-methylthioadenosine/S-adenosylhomocysteine deaminase|uniref:Amidohydrolase family protein n=1 Tax=Tissierella carlieri TaxID=689904 RepID=A0ABT1SG76_9FIRM|nr:amidohydrolase family protein [Tissierella carlieri]MBU5313376.1 amidohydrolase family protein [Tissierella carlieri]MCQ4925505.1 amidohydrolase family protein [Tissierella carlieri]MDU5082661.1 amidohydrolase family protein [Bacillota bacterium]